MAEKSKDAPKCTKYEGTVKATPGYTGQEDAGRLRSAMKGIGTNEDVIIQTLAKRTDAERQKMRVMFKTAYGHDLQAELDSELGGELKTIVGNLVMSNAEYDARELARAMEGRGTNERLIVEILASRNSTQIKNLKASYKSLFGMQLEDNLKKETSGDFTRLLMSLCVGGRLDNQAPDPAKAKQDAQALYKAGEQKLGTDEAEFNRVFCCNSYDHLKMVFEEYDKLSKKTIEQAIASETSGDFEDALLTMVKLARNRPGYFAERLYKAMKGLGTSENTVYRIVIHRSEIDMVQIKQEFQKAYGKTLEEFIAGDFSGDGKKILLAMVQ